jgi:hypothetical protein
MAALNAASSVDLGMVLTLGSQLTLMITSRSPKRDGVPPFKPLACSTGED